MRMCKVEGCNDIKTVAFNMCDLHYRRYKRTGNTHPPTRYRRHGKCNTREYQAWSSMFSRCNNTEYYKNVCYKGITICERWKEAFVNFYEDMGECPTNYQLDRKNNQKGYFKENCRWVTVEEQARNRSVSKLTPDAVKEIRNIFERGGINQRTLALMYEVSPTTIHEVLKGKTWYESSL